MSRYIALFSLALLVLINFPLLSLFNSAESRLGIPVLYLYVFITWLVLIVALVFSTRLKLKKNSSK